jgi:hypothetical protein
LAHTYLCTARGYLAWDTLEPTESILKGRTVIRLYFSVERCPPCQVFNPLLKQLHSSKQAHCDKATRSIPPFEVVLVSQCQDTRATKHYFSEMPWTAMTHVEASGKQGLALRDKFGITTIPALVLIDREGAVLCQNVQERLQEDPTGKYFPWQDPLATPRLPLVGFDLVDHSQPDVPRLSTPLPTLPGKPPTFVPVRPTLAQDSQYAKEAAMAHGDHGSSHSHQVLRTLSAKKQGKTGQGISAASFLPAKEGKGLGQAWQDCAPDNGWAKKTTTQQVVGQGPAPTPSLTLEPTATTSKCKTAASDDVPLPRPPPKPNLIERSFPRILSRAVDALAAKAATSQNQNFVLRWLAEAR